MPYATFNWPNRGIVKENLIECNIYYQLSFYITTEIFL